jgi:hypothetical protein
MSLPARGKVFIGTKTGGDFPAVARFTTDPKISRAWPPRRSRLLGIGGSTTQQDFGRFAADLRLTLASEQNWITAEFRAYLDGLLGARNATYDYADYQGVVATVVIADFEPKPTFVRDGRTVLYEYSLVLDVVTLSVLDFAAYTGN